MPFGMWDVPENWKDACTGLYLKNACADLSVHGISHGSSACKGIAAFFLFFFSFLDTVKFFVN